MSPPLTLMRLSALKQSSDETISKTPPSIVILSPAEKTSASGPGTFTSKRASASETVIFLSDLNTRAPLISMSPFESKTSFSSETA